jgi:multiple sugar transport system substrate-binding protein
MSPNRSLFFLQTCLTTLGRRSVCCSAMLLCVAGAFYALPVHAGELVINSMHSDPSAKKAFQVIIDGFQKAHPDVKVKLNTIDHESYKVQIRTWLPSQPPDVATWFAGNRARFFIEKKLVEPIDDIWKDIRPEFSEGARGLSSYNGSAFLLPLNYYHWGFYYRTDLFAAAGVSAPPKNWKEFSAAVDALLAKKLIPIAIGTKQAWPAAAWFDFLNMRVNGYEWHLRLLDGKESYQDAKVLKAMVHWRTLIAKKAFPENAPAMSWQEAAALLWQGKAGMYLMGNFIATEIPADVKDKIGFFPFPTINDSVPPAEVAPTDVIFIPAKAKNKADARLFLRYAASASAQTAYNAANGLLPPNTRATVNASNPFRAEGQKLLSEAQGLSQFFDRDADPQVAKTGMDGFVELMAFPDRLPQVLQKIETTRKRVHK